VPSLAPETSSLVSMESLASGTPVITFPSGALPDIVEDGRTGFLVESAAEMARAIRHVDRIDPETCRLAARSRFSADRMLAEYLNRYRLLTEGIRAADEPSYTFFGTVPKIRATTGWEANSKKPSASS